ncbi:MAG: methyltransferase [Polyangiaceae bacterium]|nr:methyltransferase [Polyangiaceae bacterium]
MNAPIPPPMALYQLATAHYGSQALYVAAKLGIADFLADGPRSADALAKDTETHAPSLRRVLRLLAASGVLVEEEDGRFSLTPVGATLKSGPGSTRAVAELFAGPMVWPIWGDLLNSVRTGAPAFERVFGVDTFGYLENHPEEAEVFDQAMAGFTSSISVAVAAAYDFSAMGSVIDIGGGEGALLVGILRANPQLRGTVFDLPRVGDRARSKIAEAGLADRYDFKGGDFFEGVPSGHDAYLLKHVIHDWDDDRARRILGAVRRAAPPSGKLLVVEGIYPPRITGPELRGPAANDVNMLVATGGRQRSEAEFRELYATSGFELTRIVSTPMVSIIEGAPKGGK